MATERIIFSLRVLQAIWRNFDWYGLFMNNPDAPSEDVFLAHFAGSTPAPVFSWVDKANGVTYLYDLSINQVQVTPEKQPHTRRVDDLNKALWKFLPPDLMETADHWKSAWLVAARKLDIATMQLIIEQGFDVNVADEDGFTALYHAVLPYGGSYKAVKMLVESGADLTLPIHNVEFLIEEAWKSVGHNGDASEALSIAAYLRSLARN
ncbi:hypothetical protein GCM10028805_31080 [Spirosoma harenae]